MIVYKISSHLKEQRGAMYKDGSEGLPSRGGVSRGKQQTHLEGMEVVRDRASDPLVIRKVDNYETAEETIELKSGEIFFISKWLTVKIGMARSP